MKRDKIKKLSILTLSPLSVVSTFAIISASCEPREKIEAAQHIGTESSATLGDKDAENQNITVKNDNTGSKPEGPKNPEKSGKFTTPPLIIETPNIDPNILSESFKDVKDIFDKNSKSATELLNKFFTSKNYDDLYESISLTEQLISKLSDSGKISNDKVKQFLSTLNEIISEQSELLSTLDSNELGTIQGKKDLVTLKSKFEKLSTKDFEKNIKDILDVVSKLVKNVFSSIEYRLNEADKLGEKDLFLANKYYNEINGSNSQALEHLIFLIDKYTKEYEALNGKYQPLRKELEGYNNDWWFSFKSLFRPSLSHRYNQVFYEVSSLVPQINKLVEKIKKLEASKADLTKTPMKKAK
ncbi:MAG2950 family lipoprotein [Mycoplasmopsis agalactiae]|uniref:Lipoprotein n=1 Tax=Mycoplasmopsis agalactiae (strain NCTC 10123 / CIP 59.7 / PG2) TaxID=347257 RepID=A5IY84_MYCAP|nr:hypothetical protein [Mycoplasmopsis agalactiae]CAL58993.1 Hypothetical protein, predicted lipoprotein [Mycoplasmopsis agalactiae PG2]